jgi:hypothetical protein
MGRNSGVFRGKPGYYDALGGASYSKDDAEGVYKKPPSCRISSEMRQENATSQGGCGRGSLKNFLLLKVVRPET